MNNITIDDMNPDRQPEPHVCCWCKKEFLWTDEVVNDGGIGWTPFNYHPECFKKYKQGKEKKDFSWASDYYKIWKQLSE